MLFCSFSPGERLAQTYESAGGNRAAFFSDFQDTFSKGLYHTHEKNRGDDSMNILFASPDRDLLRCYTALLSRRGHAVTAAFEEGSLLALAGACALLVAAVLTAVYIFTIVYSAFFMVGDASQRELSVTRPGPRMTTSLTLLCVLLVVLGLSAGTVVSQLYGLMGGMG